MATSGIVRRGWRERDVTAVRMRSSTSARFSGEDWSIRAVREGVEERIG